MERAVKGAVGVIHTANDSAWDTDFETVVHYAVKATTTLMRAAAKEKTVTTYVYTSSRVASFNPAGEPVVATNDTWLNEIVPFAKSVQSDHPMKAILVYASSKVEAEKAAWQFVKDEKPNYVFNAVLPDYVMGKVTNPRVGIYSTNTALNEFYNGHFDKDTAFYKFTAPASMYVDVLDVAKAHVIALAVDKVKNERIFAMVDTFSVKEIADAIHRVLPYHSLPDVTKTLPRSNITAPNTRFKSLLKEHYKVNPISLEESVARNILDA